MADEPTATSPIPAATVVVMREGRGAPELLMVERAASMRFAGGALVFPGGRIDPGDRELAAAHGDLDADEAAARIAAIRETIEEAGVALAVPQQLAASVAEMRARLDAGDPLGAVLGQAQLDLSVLVPFARWLPNFAHSHIFDTRFYLARLPDDAERVAVDGTENVRAVWMSARAVLDAADAGKVHIIFPTRRNLERLAQFDSFAAAVAHARAHPVRTITPWVEQRDGADHLCIPDDLGYPVTSQPFRSAMRG